MLGLDSILRRHILDHERPNILWQCLGGVVDVYVGGKANAQNILRVGIWWPTMFKDAKAYARACDVFQRVGNLS
jgi:hypothetical protein